MTRFAIGLVLVIGLGGLGSAQAEDPMALAERIVNEGLPDQGVSACKACHGAKGKSPIPTNPHLAGQHRSYLAHALRQYRSGERENPVMTQQAGSLTDRQIEALAGYFATRRTVLTTLPK